MDEGMDDIAKYLRGELSPAEMHALEKRALSDPFLADALEGAAMISTEDFSADIAVVKKQITEEAAKRRWSIAWRLAASIGLILVASYAVYNLTGSTNTDQLASQAPKK